MRWLVNAVLFMILMAAFIFTCFTAGYATEKYTTKDPACINSACEVPCDQVKKFKRHQGCVP